MFSRRRYPCILLYKFCA